MNKLKHTPGSWDKCHANNDECPCGLIWDNTGMFVIASVTSSCKEHESSNLGEGVIRGNDEFLANARLIAAAPDMLEALIIEAKNQVIRIPSVKNIDEFVKNVGKTKIMQTIEKATGLSIEEVLNEN